GVSGSRHKGDRNDRPFGNGSGVLLGSEHGRVPVAGGIIRRHWSPHFGACDRLRYATGIPVLRKYQPEDLTPAKCAAFPKTGYARSIFDCLLTSVDGADVSYRDFVLGNSHSLSTHRGEPISDQIGQYSPYGIHDRAMSRRSSCALGAKNERSALFRSEELTCLAAGGGEAINAHFPSPPPAGPCAVRVG